METISKFIVLRASTNKAMHTLQDLDGVIAIHSNIAALLLHVLHQIAGHALLCHQGMLLLVQL